MITHRAFKKRGFYFEPNSAAYDSQDGAVEYYRDEMSTSAECCLQLAGAQVKSARQRLPVITSGKHEAIITPL